MIRGEILSKARSVKKLVRFIEQEMAKRGWSQNELAERSSLGSGTISRIMTRQNSPSLDSLEAMAVALGYTLESFILFVIATEHDRGREQMLLDVYRGLSETYKIWWV